MTENEQKKPEDIEKPVKVIDDIIDCLDGVHRSLVGGAANVGYAIEAFREIRPAWARIEIAEIADPTALQVYASGSSFLSAFRDEIYELQDLVAPVPNFFGQLLGTVATAVNATGTTASYVPGVSFAPSSDYDIHIITPERHKEYADRFSRFDPELGKTYKEIWEALFGTESDPERAALFLIRQSYDHLFNKLSPDKEVRNSQFWTKKEGDNEEQVWREERIRYAASKHVKDQARAKTLIASAKHMKDVYDALNKAHERGELDRTKAHKAIAEMQSILEEWADALEI